MSAASCCHLLHPEALALEDSERPHQAASQQLVSAHDAQQDLLQVYVAEIPERYVKGAGRLGEVETNAQYGFATVGSLLSLQRDHWDTRWHHTDAWFNNQLMVSPLRTHEADDANVIFVPAMLSRRVLMT